MNAPRRLADSSLLAAALVGLLGTAAACTSSGGSEDSADQDADSGEQGGAASGGGTASGGASSGGTGSGGAATGGSAGAPTVTSSEVVPDLTLEDFTADCDAREGSVEIHSHCGGLVTGPGISYDSDTDVLTEHTCQGLNTCTGFSCVLGT
jgi:hypothetical protein